ncbi:hypothetical protein [Parasitella parasitica]|uniref:Uncharacterized protein n=1 Tax=Parasitella parasitica TaxID=35722 RepID=A0A0B7NIR7_9FUNG|nr:hypothetical protein [Parasitella parasitica]
MCRVKEKLWREVPAMTKNSGIPCIWPLCALLVRIQLEVQSAGLNDGEGIERFWSEFAEFTGLTRNMTEANRSLTLLCTARHLGDKKMANLGEQIATFKLFQKDKISSHKGTITF